jgi:hypothetical protein
MKNKEDLGAVVIIHVANNHRAKINSLLLRNGVQLPANASNFEVGQIVTKLLQKSKNFQKEFKKLLATPEVLESLNQYSNATGTMDFSQYNVPSTFNGATQPLYANQLTSPSALTAPSVLGSPSTTSTDTAEKPKTGFTLDKGLNLFSQGLNGFLQYSQNETDKKLAEASIAQSQSIGLVDISNQEQPKSNTALIIFASIAGIAILGGLAWYFVKNQPIKK